MNPAKILDIEEFLRHLPKIDSIKTRCWVEGEDDIVVDDILSVEVTLTRLHLEEGQAAGPICTPECVEDPVPEMWWLALVDREGKVAAIEKIEKPDLEVVVKIRLQVIDAGESTLMLHVLCDGYLGLDQEIPLEYGPVAGRTEKNRNFLVHPEDQALEKRRSFFERWLIGKGGREEDEEEEEIAEEESGEAIPNEDEATETEEEVEEVD